MERLTNAGTREAKASTTIREVTDKLAEYENLEEQGLLLRLPCKVGDTVYCIMTGLSYKNPSIFKMKFDYELIKHFGKRVFLTKEEAEASLLKMELKTS